MHTKPLFILSALAALIFIFAPPVQELSAGTGKTVQQGGSATLNWTVTGVTNCTGETTYPINSDGVQSTWQGSVRPSSGSVTFASVQAAPGTYTFTCTNYDVSPNPTDSAVLTVTAAATPAPTVTLDPFSPSGITVGQSSTISYSSTNATSCSGTGLWSGAIPTSSAGSNTGPMNTPGTYTQSVTCTGSGGSATSVTRTLVVCATGTVWNGSTCVSGSTSYLNIFFN